MCDESRCTACVVVSGSRQSLLMVVTRSSYSSAHLLWGSSSSFVFAAVGGVEVDSVGDACRRSGFIVVVGCG